MINILYEDNHILVVEKPINIPSQADRSEDNDLLSMLKTYVKEKYNKPGNVYLGLIHRLDRPVGGLMVFARTSKAANRLNEEMKNNQIIKTYHAVVFGNPKQEETLIDFLIKDEKTNISKVTTKEQGKKAILHYRLLKRVGFLNLVEINLETGRSHQIRVQMANAGYPLWGDQKYNKEAVKGDIALFASGLEFEHPTAKENMRFILELPKKEPWIKFE